MTRRRGIRRRAALAGLAVMGTAAGLGVTPDAGGAVSRNPADALLDRSRDAVETHDFTGVVRFTWWTGRTAHHRDVTVTASGGTLRIDGGEVMGRGRRSWMRQGHAWSALWTDRRDPAAPRITSKYALERSAGPRVLHRTTTALSVRRGGDIVERLSFDPTTGLLLRRDLWGDDGRPRQRLTFLALDDFRPRAASAPSPRTVGAAPAPVPAAHASAPHRVGHGFVLVGAQKVGQQTQWQYSDGVFALSVFTRDADLEWDELPRGGTDAHLGSVKVRRYELPEATVVVWESGSRTLTCVTDAPDSELTAIVTDLSREDDDGWSRAVRFLTGPFSWS